MRISLTRLSLHALVLLAGLAVMLAVFSPPAGAASSQVVAAQSAARSLVSQHHWSARQYRCLVRLWNRESGWRVHAVNPSSGAYGIPQAVPGSKMASAGPHWRTSARTQIRWGLSYIRSRYGTPCGAWAHSNAYGWY